MSISTREATVTLNGVTTVTFDRRYPYFAVRNDSSAPVYISTVNADCTAGADGVVAVPKDGSVVIANCGDIFGDGTLYLNGSGTVTIMGQYDGGNRFKVAQKGGETSKNGVLIGGTVYTGTEYNEQSKLISGLKDELTEYCGFGSDGDFIPCNADGTLGFTITSKTIQQNYGESKTKADESDLVSTYSIILKNDKIFAFKHGEKEIHVITKDTNGNPVLFWCWDSQYIITNPSGSTGYMGYLAKNNASYKHYIVPMCDFLAGNEIDGLYLVVASPSTSYTDYIVDFGGGIYRFFGQGGHQFAVKVI